MESVWNPFGQMYSEFVSTTNDVRFPGQLRDDESGLYYNWHRYYGPKVGRYYQADPIGLGGGVNLYGYVLSDPITNLDFDGLLTTDDILARLPTLPHWFVNGSAGFGDELLGGMGPLLRKWFGAEDVVDPCSRAYNRGQKIGFAFDIALGAKAGLIAAGEKTVVTEFSHFVPSRVLKRLFGGDFRSLLNGNYVSPLRHFKNDPYRYLKGMGKLAKPWPTWFMILDRTPRVYVGTASGLVNGYIGYEGSCCK
jgi:RHS repeat-associated protein